MHCWQVLTFLSSPIEWLTFCQNLLTCCYFLWKKLNFHFLNSPIFGYCRHRAKGVRFRTRVVEICFFEESLVLTYLSPLAAEAWFFFSFNETQFTLGGRCETGKCEAPKFILREIPGCSFPSRGDCLHTLRSLLVAEAWWFPFNETQFTLGVKLERVRL